MGMDGCKPVMRPCTVPHVWTLTASRFKAYFRRAVTKVDRGGEAFQEILTPGCSLSFLQITCSFVFLKEIMFLFI